jgi:hypothetical protein
MEIWSGRRDSNPRPQPWQDCGKFAKITRQLGFFIAARGRDGHFAHFWSGSPLIDPGSSRHDRIEIGLLEHGIPCDHPHARPSGDLAERPDISSVFQKPNGKVVPPVVDAEPLDPSLFTRRAMSRCERVAAGLTCVGERLTPSLALFLLDTVTSSEKPRYTFERPSNFQCSAIILVHPLDAARRRAQVARHVHSQNDNQE